MVTLKSAVPILFVRDVEAAARYYKAKLGFEIDFLDGEPPFYGAVSRDEACLHLRQVRRPNFAQLVSREPALILATIEVNDVAALFEELGGRGAEIVRVIAEHSWGGTDFYIRDPDGNVISFVQYGALSDAMP